MSDEELEKAVEEVDVFARLNPLQKERVVKTYKKNENRSVTEGKQKDRRGT